MSEFTESPIAPNPRQVNMDRALGTINRQVLARMKETGALKDTEPGGRRFIDGEHNLFGYNGVVCRNGQIVSLVDINEGSDVPAVELGREVTIVGDSRGYVSSGHKPGERVRVIGFIEPFFHAGNVQSSDKIIEVEGGEEGVIGWIKPSEFDKKALRQEKEEEIRKLFEQRNK